jgi:hypothetical protein
MNSADNGNHWLLVNTIGRRSNGIRTVMKLTSVRARSDSDGDGSGGVKDSSHLFASLPLMFEISARCKDLQATPVFSFWLRPFAPRRFSQAEATSTP